MTGCARLFPTVDRQYLASDPPSIVGREEQHAVRDVLGCTESLERDPLDQRALAFLAVRLPLTLGRRIRAHESRRDVVDRDVPRPELVRELARQPDLRRLRRSVRLNSRETDPQSRATRDVDDPTALRGFH